MYRWKIGCPKQITRLGFPGFKSCRVQMELDHDTMYYSDYLEAVGLQQKQYLSKQNTLISWQKLLPNFKKPLHCFGSLKNIA